MFRITRIFNFGVCSCLVVKSLVVVGRASRVFHLAWWLDTELLNKYVAMAKFKYNTFIFNSINYDMFQ